MRIFKKTYKDKKTGERKQVANWTVEFRDHEEAVRRWAGFSDKARSMELGRKLTMLVQCRITGDAPDIGLNAWLETLPTPLRRKLGETGLLHGSRMALAKPLSEHIADFRKALEAKGNTARYIEQKGTRLQKVFDGCGFTSWSDITGAKVQAYLHSLRSAEKPITARTLTSICKASNSSANGWWVSSRLHHRQWLTLPH